MEQTIITATNRRHAEMIAEGLREVGDRQHEFAVKEGTAFNYHVVWTDAPGYVDFTVYMTMKQFARDYYAALRDESADRRHSLPWLCRDIVRVMAALEAEHRADYQRVYEKTWTIAHLHHEGLAHPTEDARARLEDLHNLITTQHALAQG